MAPKRMTVLMVLVAILWAEAKAQSGCMSAIIGMAQCLNYVTGTSLTPSSSCCSQLATVVRSQPLCLCSVINGGGASLGITINQILALALPGACNVQTPPVSQCNAADGTKTSPVDSPTASPVDSNSNGTPGSPTAPSMQTVPRSGSKTVPSTGKDLSDGNFIKLSSSCLRPHRCRMCFDFRQLLSFPKAIGACSKYLQEFTYL